MIVWLAYYPGSGHAAIRHLFKSAFDIDLKNSVVPKNPSAAAIETSAQAKAEDDTPTQRIVFSETAPQGVKKSIYVVENPYTAIPALHARLKSENAPNLSLGSVILGGSEAGSWSAHVQAWRQSKYSDTLTINLEDIWTKPDEVAHRLGEFLAILPSPMGADAFAPIKEQSVGTMGLAENLSSAETNLLGFLFKDEMKLFGYAPKGRTNRLAALTQISKISRDLYSQSGGTIEQKSESDRLQLQSDQNHLLLSQVSELSSKLFTANRKSQDLRLRNDALQLESANKMAYLQSVASALEPRWKSILTLRPLRFALSLRNQIKRGDLELDSAGIPVAPAPVDAATEPERSSRDQQDAYSSTKPVPRASAYGSYQSQKELGIAVFTFDRGENVEHVLESLSMQSGIEHTHVWIDGDQGNPDRRKRIDDTASRVSRFAVAGLHRNRGNFGFRKMMIVAMRKMFERYERVLFLEDDCFPTRNAVQGFGYELDQIEQDPSIMSVYGHPFLVDAENNGRVGRFQGWGWATTRDKLMPLWPKLLETYLMSEQEYKAFISENLSQEILDRIDITPGRQPSSTLPNFFAWDETLGLLAAMNNLSHKPSKERLIYNFGVGPASTHFSKIDHYRAPPFNMVTIDEIWRHF